ncbi:uncharacterized protein LOC143956896 isoform X2 [Lithobates pipiens]
MTFYFCILVVCIIGLSDGTSIVCWRRGRNVTCTDDHQSPTEGHEKEIHVRCDNREIICPIIPSLSKVTNDDMKFQELKCGTNKSREPDQKCEIYYCQIENSLYMSALRTILSRIPRVQDLARKAGIFWKNASDLLALLRNKGYFTGKEYTEYISPICEEDDYDSVITTTTDDPNYENNEVSFARLYTTISTFTIMASIIVLLLILAVYSLCQWKKRNAQNHSS